MSDFERIVVLDNEVEAQFLDAELSALNIPHFMRSYHDSAFDGVFQMSSGWGHVEADVTFRDRILNILHDIRHSQEDLEDTCREVENDSKSG